MARDEHAGSEADVLAELKRLGRQVGETLETAWKSAERKRAQEELMAGARAFVNECEEALRRAGSARPAELTTKARRSTAEAIRWLSTELDSLARRFTPAGADAEKEPGEADR